MPVWSQPGDVRMLHLQLLSWHVERKAKSALPPDFDATLDNIPSRFAEPVAYQNSFNPPLLVECWEQIRQAFQKPPAAQLDLDATDSFEDGAFTSIGGEFRCDFYLKDDPIWKGDLVKVEHRGATFLAIAEECDKLAQGRYQVWLHCCAPVAIALNAPMGLNKLLSLHTMDREYSALQAFEALELSESILNPHLKISCTSKSTVSHMKQAHALNESQARAVATSLRQPGFSLIQGPPGTGKTSTIVALVAAHRGPRLLICAPSNAAADELAKRLMKGLPSPAGDYSPVRVVRLGREEMSDPAVRPILLRNIVDEEVRQSKQKPTGEQWSRLRIKVLSDADVVISTLSGAGSKVLNGLPFDFPTVIIDEAGQTVEVSSIIPLKYGCTRCILVGDPLQLPPTVMSSTAKDSGYDRSLFVRLMEHDSEAVNFLSVQHRMHPDISSLPSTHFYGGRLTDGPGMATKTKRKWHESALFPPYAFMDVAGREAPSGTSKTNAVEAEVALSLCIRLLEDFPPSEESSYSIGVVTPYKAQKDELERIFQNKFGLKSDLLNLITFNTGFQGQEKDIIILSCVRAEIGKSVGFLSDRRRMNVALTRAKSSCFVLGDSRRLVGDEDWLALIDDAKSRKHFRQVGTQTFVKQRGVPGLPPTATAVIPSESKSARRRRARATAAASRDIIVGTGSLSLGS